jgi:hypothetical protein
MSNWQFFNGTQDSGDVTQVHQSAKTKKEKHSRGAWWGKLFHIAAAPP